MIKPIYNRRFGEWNEVALGGAMLALEREYFKRKQRGFLPCDLKTAKNVVMMEPSKSMYMSSTTKTEGSSTPKSKTAKRVVGPDRSKMKLAKIAVKTEAMEMLHKMRHINPEYAEKLEAEFKREGVI